LTPLTEERVSLGIWVPVLDIINANDGAIGPKRSLTITSTYVTRWMDRHTDKWTWDDSKDRTYA